MSSSNCCFLACIQISQGAGQVVWYSHLFQNFLGEILITSYADDTTLVAESEEELKGLLIKVKEESGKSWLKAQHSEN